jgi:hypothetical protein
MIWWRESPDHKHENGSENYSGKHNPKVTSSSLVPATTKKSVKRLEHRTGDTVNLMVHTK